MKADVLHLLEMLGFEAREPKQVRQVIYYPYHFEAPATNNEGNTIITTCDIVMEDDDDTEDVTRKIIIEATQKEHYSMQSKFRELIGIVNR